MITRLLADHHVKISPTCGEIHEILRAADYPHLTIALAIDLKPTHAHFHKTFDEIYFILDGFLLLKFYDPSDGRIWEQTLQAGELVVISKGIHHQVVEGSGKNRLSVLCVPGFDPDDETFSDKM